MQLDLTDEAVHRRTRPAISVIVAAHDEQIAIARCLEALLAQDVEEPFEVLVVANGCQDSTAAIAREHVAVLAARGCTLHVLELAEGSKPAAMNAGDDRARAELRAYLDADAELSSGVLGAALEALAGDGAAICGPRIRIAPSGHWLVDAYAQTWSGLPYVRRRVVGAGFYAVNAAGRARWSRFPSLLSDDTFVSLQFASSEHRVLRGTWMTTYLPTSLPELIRVRARWSRGSRQIARLYPELGPPRGRRWLTQSVRYVLRRPSRWLPGAASAALYVVAVVCSRVDGRAGIERWSRAASSPVRTEVRSTAKAPDTVRDAPGESVLSSGT